jgi:hypothetical protein
MGHGHSGPQACTRNVIGTVTTLWAGLAGIRIPVGLRDLSLL